MVLDSQKASQGFEVMAIEREGMVRDLLQKSIILSDFEDLIQLHVTPQNLTISDLHKVVSTCDEPIPTYRNQC